MRNLVLNFNLLAIKLSFLGAILALIAFFAIPVLVISQILGRTFGFSVAGAPEYASYSFATVAFLGLAYAMSEFTHIRVSFMLDGSDKMRRMAELVGHAIGSILSGFALYIAWVGVGFSLKFNDISQGHDATALWIPQSVMVIGFALLFLVVFSRLLVLIFIPGHEFSTEKSIIEEES